MKQLATIGLLCLAMLCVARAESVQTRTFEYRMKIPARTFAREARSITNPLTYPQLKFVIPDGTYVEAGTVLMEFDRESLQLQLENQEQNRAIEEADLQRKLTELRNRDLELKDEQEALEDRLAVLLTQLNRLRSLPEPDEVTIAQGRLKVAKLEFDAAEEDMATARDRFDREMISPGEFDTFEKAFREAKARLVYREGLLEVASRPADDTTIEKTDLAIANIRLELKKLENEINRNREISKIESNAAKAEVEEIESEIEETRTDIKNSVVRAPANGHVVYAPSFRRYLGSTYYKMWKEFLCMTMPIADSVALKAQIPESERRFFNVGDPVEISVAGRPGETLEGDVASISALARHVEERDQQRYRASRGSSGIMVYDLVILPKTRPAWLRVGLNATCEIFAATPVRAPAIPATHVKSHQGNFYLSIKGSYQPVEGFIFDGYLLLSDTRLEGRQVDLFGTFPERRQKLSRKDKPASGYRVSGELTPADTADVSVGDVYKFQKIAWLIAEDTVVTQGQVLVRLDPADTEEVIKKTEANLRQAVNVREKEIEESKLRETENLFMLTEASNLWHSARLAFEELLDGRETKLTLQAAYNLDIASIRSEFLGRELRRIEHAKVSAYSPLEKSRLRRDVKRAALHKEAAEIQRKELRGGATPEMACRAELEVRERKNIVVGLRKKLETDGLRKSYDLIRAQQYERRIRDNLEERYLEKKNLTLYAPRGGLLRYGMVRNGSSWSKVDVGGLISDRAVPVYIADVSRMYVRVEVPEKYYTQTRVGMEVDLKPRDMAETTFKGTVSEIEFLFVRKSRIDSDRGLYASHESLGETVFYVRVEVEKQAGGTLKPGATADVVFPFGEKKGTTDERG